MLSIRDLVFRAHSTASANGFWDEFDEMVKSGDDKYAKYVIGTQLMLIVSELSEAIETYRKSSVGWREIKDCREKDNFTEELADAIIRIGDLAGKLGLPLEEELDKKMKRNDTRPHKHGKLF